MRLSTWTPSLWALTLNTVLAQIKPQPSAIPPATSPTGAASPTPSPASTQHVSFNELMGAAGMFGDRTRILVAGGSGQSLSWNLLQPVTPQKLELWNLDSNEPFGIQELGSPRRVAGRDTAEDADLVPLTVNGNSVNFHIETGDRRWSNNFLNTTYVKLSWYDGESLSGSSPSQAFVIAPDNSEKSISAAISVLQKGNTPPQESSSAIVGPTTTVVPGVVTPTPNDNTPPTTSSNGLSPGAIAGIVIGAVAALALIGGLVWFFCFRRRKQQNQSRKMGYGNDAGAAAMIADKEQPGVSESSPHSAYGDDGGRLHDRGSAVVDPSYMPYSDHAPQAQHTPPVAHAAPIGHGSIPPQTTGGTMSTSQEASTIYAHLVEEGMTPEEIRRLEEEERALDQAIDAAGHNRSGAH